MKNIGIIACSPEGASLCYRNIFIEAQKAHITDILPEVSMHMYPMIDYINNVKDGKWDKVRNMILDSLRKLSHVGADFVICPCNTVHVVYDQVASESPIPWLHIVEPVVHEAQRKGIKRAGLLGTESTTTLSIYDDYFKNAGIELVKPKDDVMKIIDDIIFTELVYGKCSKSSQAYIYSVINSFKSQSNCDAVILGCTEIPLALSSEPSLSILDSATLLARAAINRSLEQTT